MTNMKFEILLNKFIYVYIWGIIFEKTDFYDSKGGHYKKKHYITLTHELQASSRNSYKGLGYFVL